MWLQLGNLNFTRIFQFLFFLLKRDKMVGVGWSWIFPFLPVSKALIKPQYLRLWLNCFSWVPTLLRRTQCPHVFQKVFFLPSTAKSTREFFSNIYCQNFVELLEVKFTKTCPSHFPMTESPGVFKRFSCHLACSNSSVTFLYSGTGSRKDFCSGIFWFCVSPFQFL
jgi:hypothetical protein